MKSIALIVIGLLLASCSNDKIEYEKVILHYNNGNLFCSGNHKVINSNNKLRSGNWKFYYPSGKIEQDVEYNEDGEIISQKKYSENGKIVEYYIIQDKTELTITYHQNGNIKEEIKKEKYSENKGDDESETSESIVKEFYDSGVLKEQTNYKDDNLNGEKKIWDSTGVLLIIVNYADGIIIRKDLNN